MANQGAVATLLVHIINFITSKRAGCTSKMLKAKKIRIHKLDMKTFRKLNVNVTKTVNLNSE